MNEHSEEDHSNGCTTRCWPLPWSVAAAIALLSGLDWGFAASGRTRECAPGFCLPAEFCGDGSPGDISDGWDAFFAPINPSDAEAYLRDCARRGVEPGPLPSLSWTGPDLIGWSVSETSEGVRVAFTFRGHPMFVWHAIDDSLRFVDGLHSMTRSMFAWSSTLATEARRVVTMR